MKKMDELGREIPDPVPRAPPVGFRRELSMAERVRRMVRSETLALEAERAGYESFAEADDFDVDDEMADPETPYEALFDPPVELTLQTLREEFGPNSDRYVDYLERAVNELRGSSDGNETEVAADSSADAGGSPKDTAEAT